MDEYARLLEERDMAETDYSLMEDEMRKLETRGLKDGDEEWEKLDYEMNAKSNEIMYLDSLLAEYENEDVLYL